MKKTIDFIIGKVVLPAVMIGPFVLLFFIIYDSYQREAALRDVCQTMGGVYVDHTICIEGKNLFGGK